MGSNGKSIGDSESVSRLIVMSDISSGLKVGIIATERCFKPGSASWGFIAQEAANSPFAAAIGDGFVRSQIRSCDVSISDSCDTDEYFRLVDSAIRCVPDAAKSVLGSDDEDFTPYEDAIATMLLSIAEEDSGLGGWLQRYHSSRENHNSKT